MKIYYLALLSLLIVAISATPNTLVWPWPRNLTEGQDEVAIAHPCNFTLKIVNDTKFNDEINAIFRHYKSKVFKQVKCDSAPTRLLTDKEMIEGNSFLMVEFTEDITNLFPVPGATWSEEYNLEITVNQSTIKAKNYVGFVRGIETFFQIVTCKKNAVRTVECKLPYLPIKIHDLPAFPHRGIMIDTSRHFYPLDALKQLIDGMMYAKMSVFHWHITDTDSFPLELTKIPDITKFGAFSEDEIYHVEEIKEFLHYAAMRGVRVIPEIDMPAHTLSWGFAPEYKEIIACGGDGVINPTMQKTKDVLDAIWGEIMEVFKDEYVHFGIDEVPLGCWQPIVEDLINKAKTANTTAEYKDTKELAIAFKTSLKERTPGKKHMVWYRGGEQVPFGEDEVLQFWDGSGGVNAAMEQRPNNTFVVSPMDTFYLDCGVGNAFGDGSWCGGWHGWRTMYDFDPFTRIEQKLHNRLLGAEGTLWSERANADVLEARIWPRLLSLSERFWSNFTNAEGGVNQNHFMYLRIHEMINRMRFKGIKSEPITSGLCEREGNCF